MKKLFTLISLFLIFKIATAQSVGGTVNPANTTVCTGSNSGILTLSGQTGAVTRWESSINSGTTWVVIANVTTTQAYSNLAVTTWYRAVVTQPTFPSANSSIAIITVDATSAGTVTPTPISVCSGINSGTLTVNPGAFTTVNFWETSTNGGTSWTNIGNAGSTTQSYSNLTLSTLYRADITNNTCPSAKATSSSITVSPASVGGTTSGATTVCAGSNSGTLTLSGYTGSIVRWETSTNGGITWVVVANTTNTNNFLDILQTTDYRAVVQSGVCADANSTPVTVTVTPVSAGGTTAGAASVCAGANSGSVTLSAQTGNIVRWESSTDGGTTWSNIVNTTTTQSYSNLVTTTIYRALVQSGGCTAAYSTNTTITVSPATVAGSVSGAAAVCAGSNSGTLTLSGYTGGIVRWQSSIDGGITWVNIANVTATNNYSNIAQTTDYRAVVQSGTCAADNSSTATITVNPVSVGGATAGAASVCAGANSGSITLSGQTGNVTGWEFSTDGDVTWTPIVNTTTTQNYSNLNTTTDYHAIVQSGGCASAVSASSLITVSPATVGGSVSGSTTACAGSNSGTLTLSGQTGNVIRWESSINGGVTWVAIANVTTINNYSNIAQTTAYRAVVQSGGCALANSSSAVITISPVSAGGVVASAATVCSGANNGTLVLTGYTGSVIRWEKSTDGGSTWTAIANTTDNNTYNNLTVNTLFRAVVQSGGCASANSNSVLITVSPASVGGNVSGSASACSGTNSGTLILSGHTGSIVRWESSIDGGVTWVNIANTTTFLNYSNITQTTDYRAILQSGSCPTANSSVATVTIFPISVGGTANSSATVCSGSNNGTIQLTGYTGNVTSWEQSIDNGATWTNIVNASDTISYTNLTVKTLFRANVQSGACTAKKSTTATITINSASVGGTVAGAASSCSGSNNGTLTLSGYVGSIVRWQSSIDGGVTWVNIANVSAINNYSNLTQTTDFRAVVQSGSCPAANSSVATVTIFPISVGGTVNSSATVCGGSNNGTLQLINYTGNVSRWEKSIDNGATWITIANTTDTLSYTNLTVKTLFRALVQSGACTAKYSTTATITVNASSVGGTVSASDTVCSGSNSANLTLSGYVGSIVRWQSSIDGGVTWVNIANVSAILNYTNITQTTNYRAVIQSGSCPAANSAEAIITVFPISVGGTVNSNATVCSGSNNGTLQLINYTGSVVRWEKSIDNGFTWTNIANATDTISYTNLNVKTLYRALVQSGACTAKYSTTATITVNAASAGGTVAGTDTVCSGSNSGNLTLSGYVGSIVRWQSSTDGGVTWANINNVTALYNYVNIITTTDYRAVVQNGGCSAANSTNATITVLPVSVGGSLSPVSFSACSGSNSGTIILSGQSGNILNWQSSIDGGVTWTNIANTTSAQNFQNLTVTTKYRAIVQNGQCTSAYSAVSTITVFPPTVAGNVAGSDTVCTGTNNGSLVLNGFTGSILHWEFSTDGGITWTTIQDSTAILNYTNLAITTMYRAVIQSGSCSTANSTSATILVSPATVAGSVLSSTFVCDSTTSGVLTLTGYTGNILRWEKSTDGGNTWTTIANTTNSNIYSGITVATMYRAIVQSGICPSAIAASATITLAVPSHASFTVLISPTVPGLVTFNNTSTSNNGTSYWNFGDGTNSTLTSPAHTYNKDTSFVVTLIVTDSCGSDTTSTTVIISNVGINELAYNNPNVSIYPNPFNTSAMLTIKDQGLNVRGLEMHVFDIYGKEVQNFKLESASTKLERGNLAAGIYFYKLQSPDEIIATGKIVIEQ